MIVDHHASSESLMNTATDYIRGLALMNAIYHLVSNGSLWQFGSQQLSHALALSFQRSATTNRIKENKWKLARRHAPQKLGFWFAAMRLENQLPVLEKAFFFSIFSYSVFPPQPFAIPLQAKQRHTWPFYFISDLGDKTSVNPDVLWTSYRFHSGLWGDNVFEYGPAHAHPHPQKCRSRVAREVSWAPRERSRSTQIFCLCSPCHISVRCGSSSSWNNEATFHD